MNGVGNLFCSLVVCIVIFGITSGRKLSKCGKCDESRCPILHYCVGDVVKDHCGCCAVCSSDVYQPTKKKNGACEQVKCPKFKVCVENMQGLPLCTCPSDYICRSRRQREVCGTDNITYTSRCHLRIAACNIGKRIRVSHKGPCDVQQDAAGVVEKKKKRRKAKRKNKKNKKSKNAKAKRRNKRRERRRNNKSIRKKRRYRNGKLRFEQTFGHYKWKS
ncbi:insulin-like growth factor-binding protein-related protein 1 [Haliotis cracherodii]|uniref:insulin-like growth factor-binding protein-related protein 1 n=1 Tax=Haliotis cracherodii TaxID=6455 RepID=UPI0039EAD351